MTTNTYVALDKVTVGTATPTITFTSISQNYTDLRIVFNGAISGAGDPNTNLRLGNGTVDSGANYSVTFFDGRTSTTGSGRFTSATSLQLDYYGSISSSNSSLIVDIMNYSSSTNFKTVLSRYGNTTSASYSGVGFAAGTWRSQSAINTLTLSLSTLNFAVGTTVSLYGIKSWATESTIKATGGYVYSDASYYYHVFPFSSTFTPNQSLTCDYLVIAGGGSGGGDPSNRDQGAGGGAGGLRSTVGTTGGGGTLESALSLTAQAYTITVGAGGAGSTTTGANGTNSTLSTITATGGGGGGDANESTTSGNGLTGGSGGGSGSGPSQKSAGSGTTNQGYAGGLGMNPSGGGGGGGAGGTPAAAITGFGGNGGNGVAISLLAQPTKTGVNYYYAAGGGGGGESTINPGLGGLGGGGKGGKDFGYAGVAGTGSGGGGAGTDYASSKGGNGGSGLVIIRYAK